LYALYGLKKNVERLFTKRRRTHKTMDEAKSESTSL
jgi:CDP-diacylglycerol--serine O-phosphatidyltransferase